MSDRKIRIVLADDQLLFIESLKTVLETRAQGLDVVGMAKDGASAIEAVEKLRPDVILLDVRMPGIDGVKACRMINKQFPDIHIIMLTTFDDDDYVHKALMHGAAGYLLKDIPPAELITAIHAVNEGTVSISPSIAKNLWRKQTDPEQKKQRQLPYWITALSRREKDILQLIANGDENHEIANHLKIAEQTVKNNVSIIYSKLGVENRIQAMQLFLEYKDVLFSQDL